MQPVSRRRQRSARAGSVLFAFLLASSSIGSFEVLAPSPVAAAAMDALRFDGTNDYVTFGAAPSLGLTTFTLEAWIKRTGTGVETTTSGTTGGGLLHAIPIVTKGRGEADGDDRDMNYFLGIDNATGKLAADFEEGPGGTGPLGQNHSIIGDTAVTNNAWHHIAATYGPVGTDSGVWTLYLDGVADGSAVVNEPPRDDSIQHAAIGSALNSLGAAAGFFAGDIDEVRIWDVARSGDDILASKNQELTSGTGLVGRWGMDDAGPTTVADSVGSVNGTATNGPTFAVPGFNTNNPPVAVADSYSTPQDTQKIVAGPGVLGNDTDADSDSLTATVVDDPIHGDLTLDADGGFTYDPTPGYFGPDSFTYKANDGTADSNVGTVSLAVGNTALQFNGTNQYVTMGAAPALGVTTFTLEAWVKRAPGGTLMGTGTGGLGDSGNGLPQAYPVLTKGCGEGESPANINMNYWLGVTNTGLIAADFEATGGGQNYPLVGTHSFPTGEWHHIAATYDGQVWHTYLDGSPDATLDLGTSRTPESTSIQHAAIGTSLQSNGGHAGGCIGYFSGSIDEARIWNVARDAGQIASDRDSELTTGTGLIARWGMNGASLTNVNDSVGSADGTATNGPTKVPGFVPPAAANQAPVATGDSYSTPQNTAKVVAAPGVLSNDTDADNDPLTAILVSDVSHGTLSSITDGGFTYTPTTGYNGPDSFTYKANDGAADSNTVTVDLTVTTGVNGAPNAPTVVSPGDAATGINTSPNLDVHVSDPDGDPLTVTFFGRPLASGNFVQIGQNTSVASGADTTTPWANIGAGQTFEWYATVKDATHTAITGPTWTFHTTPSTDPVFVGAGDIADCGRTQDEATGAIVAGIDGNVWTAGDNVYPSGTVLTAYTNCYQNAWGAAKARTRPVPGNHDWGTGQVPSGSETLAQYDTYFGASATDANGKSYYSYDIASSNWHVVNLDSECQLVPGGCAAGSPQELWLKSDLAANSTKNVIAIWHKPRFSSGVTNYTALQAFYDDIYAAGVDIVLDGHDHIYERTSPMNASGASDATYGIRQFTVGTGGASLQSYNGSLPTTVTGSGSTYGVLKLTLHPTSYDWVFLPMAGQTFTDSGTASVHGAPAGPADYYVDKTNGSCSDAGAGSVAVPFCTIGKAASLVTAGKTVRVLAGTYAETVNPTNSGTVGNPITFSGAPGVTVTGNGTAAGNAFRMTSKSYIVIDGFTVKDTVDYGIYAATSNHITISNNDISSAGSPSSGNTRMGIYFTNTDDSLITGNTTHHNAGDGIRLTGGSSGNVVSDNISFANAEEWQRNATGIQVTGLGSDGNTIIHNTTYANEDSGLQFYASAANNIVVGNVTYGNGDHGIDNNAAHGNTFVGNTVQGNVTAGINLEGGSSPGSGGATLANNIAIDNGLNLRVGGGSAGGKPSNISVDANSLVGTTLDYDLVYETDHTSPTIQWSGTSYTSLSAFQTAVSGQEIHGLESDPLFVNAAAVAQRPAVAPFNVAVNMGDYHLSEGSPAIDSADSGASNEPATDLDGQARIDDPATTNTGAGSRSYDDRGAYEFVPSANGHTGLQLTTSSYVVMANPSNKLGLGQFTIETWFKKTGGGTPNTTGLGGINIIPLVTHGAPQGEGGTIDANWILGINSDTNTIAADFERDPDGQNFPVSGSTQIMNDVWYHAAATYDGTNWKLYVDGAPETLTCPTTCSPGAAPQSASLQGVGLGTMITSGSTPTYLGRFDGVLDETRVWDHARTPQQISDNRDLELTSGTDLVARWGFNEGEDDAVGDSMPNPASGAIAGTGSEWVDGFVPPAPSNQAPDAPTLYSPSDGATGVSASPSLSIHVSDPDADALTVTYFGRPLASGDFAQLDQSVGVPSNTDVTTLWPNLGQGQTFEWYVTVNDGSHTAVTGPTWTFHTTPSADPVFVGAGDIGSCLVDTDTAAGNVLAGIDGNVFTTGDNVYDTGAATEYTDCYAPTPWGQPGIKDRTRPVPGNHDWGNTGTASDNLDGYFGYFGSAATDANGKSYYSYDIPASNWHIVNLDSECEDVPGGCATGSAQELWLKADLAGNASKNVIALWHRPRYSSGITNYQALQPLWDDLYAAGADILLDGHDHIYERTAPMKSGATPADQPVADPTYGIQQFTVGTGGEEHHNFGSTQLTVSQVRNNTDFGIFKLTLHASSYDWVFLPIDGSTFTDSGTGTVHGAPTTNHAPVIDDVSDQTNAVGEVVGVQITATDADGDPLTYDDGGTLPSGLSIDHLTGAISGTPDTVGSTSVTITVSDGDLHDSSTFLWTIDAAATNGYWLVASDGGIFTFGDAGFFGSTGGQTLDQPIVGMAPTATGDGYWLVASDGGIFTFGGAGFYGSKGGQPLDAPIVGMAPTPTGLGYWLVGADGAIFPFGDAVSYGSMAGIPLDKPVVGIAGTPSGAGYWLVATDGGIFAFGDAGFYGSTGGQSLDKPIVGMASTASGAGYWLVASDGGIFTFGDAGFFGSKGGQPLDQPVVGMAQTPSGNGYWLVAADGGIFTFGDAGFFGSKGGQPLDKPVVGMAPVLP